MLTPEYEAATKELYNVVIIEQKLAAKMKSDITYFVLMHEEYAETKRDSMMEAYARLSRDYAYVAGRSISLQSDHEAIEYGIHRDYDPTDPNTPEAIKNLAANRKAKAMSVANVWGSIMTYYSDQIIK